jgi:type III pantothenate kinase
LSDEYIALLDGLFRTSDVVVGGVTGAAIASVVPPLTEVLRDAVERYLHCRPLVINRHHTPDVKVLVDEPDSVGIDRLVDTVAALHRSQGPLVVVDFGSATTVNAISKDGAFLGGAIAPGVGIAADALSSRTAMLPRIGLQAPSTAIGTNTVTNMQSGLIFGFAGLVDGLVDRFRQELGACERVIATGGLADVIAPASRTIDEVAPWLTLEGISIVYQRCDGHAG